MRRILGLLAIALLVAACGDNISPAGDDDPTIDAAVPDAEVPDAMVCDPRAAGAIGGPCVNDVDCESAPAAGDGLCFAGVEPGSSDAFAPEGFCTVDDNTGTLCATNTDCGTDEVCVEWLDFTPYKTCMPTCSCENDGCPVNQQCANTFNGYRLDQNVCVPGKADAEDGDPCDGLYECNEFSTCVSDNLEFPGGECQTYACTVGTDSTCHGGTCVTVNDEPFGGNFCFDTCTSNADCRGVEGYVCFDPDGGAGTATNYCRHPHAGDVCTTAADCGGGLWDCFTVVPDGFPGGYCTQTGCTSPGGNAQCGIGSICHDPALPVTTPNYCADRCPEAGIGTPSTCRSGYTCRDTDPGAGTFGGCVL